MPQPSDLRHISFLIRNKYSSQVYSDLEVAFIISEDDAILNHLSKIMELIEGNTALISQSYYACIFHELLDFQLSDRHPHAAVCQFSVYDFSHLHIIVKNILTLQFLAIIEAIKSIIYKV